MRCVFSLLKHLVLAVQSLFRDQFGNERGVSHIVSTVIADDADTRMRNPGGRSIIHTVCNTTQALYVRYSGETEPSEDCWECLSVPTPLLVLAAPKTGHIHSAMTAWSVVCGNCMGHMMMSCGLRPSDLASGNDTIKTEVLVGDALKANVAAWRVERATLLDRAAGQILGLHVKCLVHQVNLVRKPLVLSIPGFWANLVRLGHMFEQYSFRKAFAAALVQLLQSPASFQSSVAAA